MKDRKCWHRISRNCLSYFEKGGADHQALCVPRGARACCSFKGETADRQMADDTVKAVREYGMEDECVLISLKYELIDYIETPIRRSGPAC